MKALKIILVTIAVIIGVLLIITIFLPSEMHVQQSVTVDAPKPAVFKQVNNLKNWEKWSAWHLMDTTGVFEYSDPPSGEGAFMSWDSEDESLGAGKIKILESRPNEYIKTELSFYEDKFGNGEWYFTEKDGKVEVKWEMKGDLDFFFKWLKGTMESEVNRQFKEGLNKIKDLAESEPVTDARIEITEYPEKTIIAIKDTMDISKGNFSEVIGQHFSKLFHFAGENNLEFNGMPMTITHQWSETEWTFEAALPVMANAGGKTEGEIYFSTTPSGKMVHTVHTGPYEQLEPVYNEIMAYIQKNNLEIAGPSFEVYANDPGKVPPEEIKTEIYFPVK